MSYTPIGLEVAAEVLEAMRLVTARFWYEWQVYYDRATQEQKEALQLELQQKLEACRVGAMSDGKVAVDAEDVPNADYLGVKLIAAAGATVTEVAGSHGQALAVGADLSDLDPLPDAAEADPGVSPKVSRADHVHPLVRPTKIRYYLSDTHGSGDYTGHLLLTENPYPLEANAIDYEEASEWAVFVSALGSPGIPVWQGGVVHAHLRVKLINPQVGRTYKLYTGNGDIVYTSMIWDWTHSDTYQVKESAPTEPAITTTYADLDFDVPVTALAAGTDGRLGLNMRLRVFVGSTESTFSGEQIVIRVGGDNASYLDTLFTPDGGFSGVHNDLDGRDAGNCHPQASIEPGLILGNMGATVATVDGLLTLPPKTNAFRISGDETLLGISTAGITAGTVIYVTFASSRLVRNGGTPGTGFECLSFTNLFGAGAQPFSLLAPLNGAVTLKLSGGGVWTVLSAPWVETQRPLWPAVANVTINTTTAPGLLELPSGCPEVIYVTGTGLRAITVLIDDGENAAAGPQGALKLIFANDCTLYHDDPLTGWDAGLAARSAKLDLLPPADAEGSARDMWVGGKRVVRFWRDWSGDDPLWVREVAQ